MVVFFLNGFHVGVNIPVPWILWDRDSKSMVGENQKEKMGSITDSITNSVIFITKYINHQAVDRCLLLTL